MIDITSVRSIMAVEIELFHSVRKFIQMMGIYPSEPNQKYSFKLRSALILLSLILPFISKAAYFLFKAQTIAEQAKIFYLSMSEIFLTLDFVAMCLEMRNILQLIEKYEKFIEKSWFSELTGISLTRTVKIKYLFLQDLKTRLKNPRISN